MLRICCETLSTCKARIILCTYGAKTMTVNLKMVQKLSLISCHVPIYHSVMDQGLNLTMLKSLSACASVWAAELHVYTM